MKLALQRAATDPAKIGGTLQHVADLMPESYKRGEVVEGIQIDTPHEHTSDAKEPDNPDVANSNPRNKSTFSKQLGS